MQQHMSLKSRFLLKTIWRLKGQLRYSGETPKEVDGVSIAPFKNGARAAASISADLELCWAWRGCDSEDWERRAVVERANVPSILRLLDEQGIPITWATVGHLFLQSCSRGHEGIAHPRMARPVANRVWTGDWYAHDPCSNVGSAPGWYAPDLIRMIQSSKVRHEIGTHSFSHIDFSKDTSTEELVRQEIQACIAAMDPFGVKPRSLVFCFNRMGHHYLDLLYQLGIIAVRHRDARVRLADPERTSSGAYKIYESMNLRLAQHYNYFDKAKIFIDEAIKRGASYHVWFHPSDDERVFRDALGPIAQYLAAKQRSNQIWVATMGELASYREARKQMVIRTERGESVDILHFECPLDRDRFGDPEVTLQVRCEHAPRAISATTTQEPSMPKPLAFSFDTRRRTAMFNVSSSVDKLVIEWPGSKQKPPTQSRELNDFASQGKSR